MAVKSNKLVKTLVKRQEFNYSKGVTALNFSLCVDNSSELRAFKTCLEAALVDIEEILEGMKS